MEHFKAIGFFIGLIVLYMLVMFGLNSVNFEIAEVMLANRITTGFAVVGAVIGLLDYFSEEHHGIIVSVEMYWCYLFFTSIVVSLIYWLLLHLNVANPSDTSIFTWFIFGVIAFMMWAIDIFRLES